MPLEIDDASIRIIGNNYRALKFYDDGRTLCQEIYLQSDNTLNIGDTSETGSGGGSAMTVHALSGHYHSGYLDSAQAPQFLLLSGARAMAGALDMGTYAITNVGLVDGVDVSAHAADVNAHHAQLHGATHAAAGGDAVDHDALSNFVADEHVAHSGVTLTAGDGLTGGGTIAASRTFAVGAGTLITVAADSVGITAGANYQFIGTGAGTAAAWQNVSTLAGNGLTSATGVLAVGAGDGIDVAADAVAVDVTDFIDTAYGLTEDTNNIRVNLASPSGLSFSTGALQIDDAVAGAGLTIASKVLAVGAGTLITVAADTVGLSVGAAQGQAIVTGATPFTPAYSLTPTWAGLHTFNAGIDVNGTLEFQGAQSITSTAGDLTISPTGDLVLNPTGAHVRIAASHTLQSNHYASQVTGWGITYGGSADFRYVYTDELHAKAFIADLEQALAGGQIISKSVAILSRAFTAPAAGAATTLYVRDLPSAEDMAVFQTGDIVRLRTFSRAAGSLTIADCWGVVTAYSDLADKEQSWTFTRSAAPNAGAMSAGTVVAADAIVLDYGTTGNGFYEVNAIDGAYAVNSPYSQIVTWATHPATGQTVRTRLGNLYGITAVSNEYGLFAGNGVTAGDQYLRLSSYAFELHNINLAMYDSGNVQRIELDAGADAAALLMWAGESESNPGFAVYGDGTVWLSTLAISESLGQSLFSAADGLLLLGPGCAITPTSWTSTRGQAATLSGAFHRVAGRWAESKALVVEVAATNLILNAGFEYDNVGHTTPESWTTSIGTEIFLVQGGTLSPKQLKVVTAATSASGVQQSVTTNTSASTTYTLTAYLQGSGTVVMFMYDSTGGSQTLTIALTSDWKRYSLTKTFGAGASRLVGFVTNAAVATTFYVDNVQLEQSVFSTSYCDGSLGTGYNWSGTAHNSTSVRTATVANLDAYAPLISNQNTLTLAMWAQMPYDSDATWAGATNSNMLFDSSNVGYSDRIYAVYNVDTDIFRVYIMGGYRLESPAQAFSAGDWKYIVVTLDFTNDSYALYVDGALADTDTTALAAPTATTRWKIGSAVDSTAQGGFSFAEYAVFGNVLTAEEVAGLYAAGRPLQDMGAFKRPGVYILDGEFDLRSAQTGARVQMDANGIGGYSAATTQTFSLQTDGDLFLGSNISAAATTALAVFATAQTYNSESLGAGDVLLGDNSANKANILWDVSAGKLQFRGGTTMQCEIGTDGKLTAGGGKVSLSTTGIGIEAAVDAETYTFIKFNDSGTEVANMMLHKYTSTKTYDLSIYNNGGVTTDYLATVTITANADGTKTSMISLRADNESGTKSAALDLVCLASSAYVFVDTSTTTGMLIASLSATPSAMLQVEQNSTSGAKPVLQLNQADVDQHFIDFQGGTVYTGKTAADEYVMVKAGANTRYIRLYS